MLNEFKKMFYFSILLWVCLIVIWYKYVIDVLIYVLFFRNYVLLDMCVIMDIVI